jgi:hypothetical protein
MDKLPMAAYCVCGPGEKPYIERALKSVGFADQRIFVSDHADESVLSIARELGWDIFSWTGRNSMSERRNYAVGWKGDKTTKPQWTLDKQMSSHYPKLKYDWVIQVDDDEVYDRLFKDFCKQTLSDKLDGLDAISIDLRNVFVDTGKEMSSTPLPRLFRAGKVHWEKDIQNDVIYDGGTGWMPCIMRHYGYGSLYDHWEKQWNRLLMNEQENRKKPFDLNARGYLVNCLSVVGGDPINQARLIGHVAESITQFNKKHKRDRGSQICIERTIRHIWATCANSGNFAVFVAILSRVEESIDWIVDVPYWKIKCAFQAEKINWDLVDKYGREYLKAMKSHRTPPVLNVEVQSIGEEIGICEDVYSVMLNTLAGMKSVQMSVDPKTYSNTRKEVAKRAQWWIRQKDRQVFYKFLSDNGIDPYSMGKEIEKHIGVIHENEFYQRQAIDEIRGTA